MIRTMMAYLLPFTLFLSVADNSAVAGRPLKGGILLGLDAPSSSTPASTVKLPHHHSKNPTRKLINLPRKVFGFSRDELEHQEQMADIKRFVQYLDDESKAAAENVESHFVVDASGKVSSVMINAHRQPDGTKKLPRLQQKKVALRRPSSWARKLGPYDPLQGTDRRSVSGVHGAERASNQQRAQFEKRMGGNANQLPMNGNLTIILLFFAVLLSVSLAIVIPVDPTVASKKHVWRKGKIATADHQGDYFRPLMPKSPTKFSSWLVRGRKPRKLKDEELQGDNLV